MITKEQFNDYMEENWNEHFHGALLQCVREQLFPEKDPEKLKDYREELKQLIWEAVSDGVKTYLDAHDGETIDIIAKGFSERISEKTITVKLE